MVLNSSEIVVTNDMIDVPEKAPFATNFIKSLVPKWKEYALEETEEQKTKFALFQSCIVYQTAIYCYAYVRNSQVKARQTPDIKIEYSTSSVAANLQLELQDVLKDILARIKDDEQGQQGFIFRVTGTYV